ncbi:hypothetical protein [Anianabacter salinae]|uniref:hypothetical protein n=1 Tax=Anianabacter salinae TaxID=2851023 RepID=UPI00225DE5B8|nr:hypothetical protein [Anianabacter salinae]MBV0913634.1 hypothetical protein [Anianabacter salinae]
MKDYLDEPVRHQSKLASSARTLAGLFSARKHDRHNGSLVEAVATRGVEQALLHTGPMPPWTAQASLTVVGPCGTPFLSPRTEFSTAFRSARRVDSLGDCARVVGPTTGLIRVVAVDVDGLGIGASLIDDLAAMRRMAPELLVVLGSTDFARHDFSAERMPIADASVRLPASRTVLGLALCAARTNRAIRRCANV